MTLKTSVSSGPIHHRYLSTSLFQVAFSPPFLSRFYFWDSLFLFLQLCWSCLGYPKYTLHGISSLFSEFLSCIHLQYLKSSLILSSLEKKRVVPLTFAAAYWSHWQSGQTFERYLSGYHHSRSIHAKIVASPKTKASTRFSCYSIVQTCHGVIWLAFTIRISPQLIAS